MDTITVTVDNTPSLRDHSRHEEEVLDSIQLVLRPHEVYYEAIEHESEEVSKEEYLPFILVIINPSS